MSSLKNFSRYTQSLKWVHVEVKIHTFKKKEKKKRGDEAGTDRKMP